MIKYHIKTPAKINLGLTVNKKQNLNDPFHEISTIIAPIAIYDEIVITSNDFEDLTFKSSVEISDLNLKPVYLKFCKTFADLLENSQSSKNIHVALIKNIPIGAGLGGESSNIAAFFHLLLQYFRISPSTQRIDTFLCDVGSDTSFFYYQKFALATQKGNTLTFLSVFDDDFIYYHCGLSYNSIYSKDIYIIMPLGLSLRTKVMYKSFDSQLHTDRYSDFLSNYNSFLGVACTLNPLFKVLSKKLRSLFKYCGFTGSGSAFYIFDLNNNEEKTRKQLEKLDSYISKKTGITLQILKTHIIKDGFYS